MLGVTGGRRPVSTWRIPAGFSEKLEAAWSDISGRCVEQAGGDPQRVTRDLFVSVAREALPDLTPQDDDYLRQVALVVLQQARGSNVFFADLEYLHSALREGRVYPSEQDPPGTSLSTTLFATQTSQGTKTLDLAKSTGVNWKIPRGFLSRYNAVNQEVLRRATSLVGARHDGNKDVVAGVWGRVDVATFVEACRQVLEGGLSPEEEEYVAALASEQVPAGTPFIRDLPFLDKCLQQGRTPTAIKGPVLLPTIFLNDTTSGKTDGLTLRHTGGRIF